MVARQNIVSTTLLLLAIVLSLLLRSPIIFFIITGLYLSHRTFDRLLSASFFTSAPFRLVVSTFLYTIVLQCIALITWVVHPNTSLLTLSIITCVMLAIIQLFINRAPRHTKTTTKSTAGIRYDIIAILISLIALAFLAVPTFFRGGTISSANVVRFVNANVDDAWHLTIINDHLMADRGVLTGYSSSELLKNSARYPAGWHTVNAIVFRALNPGPLSGSTSLVLYVLTKFFWFGFLIYIAVRVALQLWDITAAKAISWTEGSALSLLFLYFLQAYIPSFMEGFYTFTPQIISTILVLALVVQVAFSKRSDSGSARSLALLTFVTLGGGLFWFLPLPAFAMFLLSALILLIYGKGWVKRLVEIAASSLRYIPFYLLSTLAIIIQAIVLAKESTTASQGFVQSLLTPGGITIFSTNFYILVALGLALFATRSSQRKEGSRILPFIASLLGSILAFATAIYLYQQIKLGTNAYYYYKIIHLFIGVALVVSVVGHAQALSKYTRTGIQYLGVVCIALLLVINLVGPESTILKYVLGSEHKVNPFNSLIYGHLQTMQADGTNARKEYYISPSSLTANVLLKSTQPISSCFNQIANTVATHGDIKAVDQTAIDNCGEYTIYLAMSTQDMAELTNMQLHKIIPLSYDQLHEHTMRL